jgi:hypothetical protein
VREEDFSVEAVSVEELGSLLQGLGDGEDS